MSKILNMFRRLDEYLTGLSLKWDISQIHTRIRMIEFSDGRESHYYPEYYFNGRWLNAGTSYCWFTENTAKKIIDDHRERAINDIKARYAKTTRYITYP